MTYLQDQQSTGLAGAQSGAAPRGYGEIENCPQPPFYQSCQGIPQDWRVGPDRERRNFCDVRGVKYRHGGVGFWKPAPRLRHDLPDPAHCFLVFAAALVWVRLPSVWLVRLWPSIRRLLQSALPSPLSLWGVY